MESVIFSTSLKSLENIPPIPLPTYLWEDIRRLKNRGGYPWTYLYKRSLSDFQSDFEMKSEQEKKVKKDPCFIIPLEHVEDFKENYTNGTDSNLMTQKNSSISENCIVTKSSLRNRRSSTDSCNRHKKQQNFIEKLSTKFPKFKSNVMQRKTDDTQRKVNMKYDQRRKHSSSPDYVIVPLRSHNDGYLGESQENFNSLEMINASPLSQKKVTFNKVIANNKFTTNNENDYEPINNPTNDNAINTLKCHRSESDVKEIGPTLLSPDNKLTIDTKNQKQNNLFNNKQLRNSFRNHAQKLKVKANQIRTNCANKLQCPKLNLSQVRPSVQQINSYPKSIIKKLKNIHVDDWKPPKAAIRKKKTKLETRSLGDLQFKKFNNDSKQENDILKETSSLNISEIAHKHGVLEEINGDEFFLRQKGISQDNINERSYLSLEIRDAFRNPINSLNQLERGMENNNQISAPCASEESINDYSREYPLMRQTINNDKLSHKSIDVHNEERKIPEIPKRRSKSLRQLHFRNDLNQLKEKSNIRPVAPKRTKSKISLNNNNKPIYTMVLKSTSPATRPIRVHRMQNTIRLFHTIPRSTLSLSIPERPKRSYNNTKSRKISLKSVLDSRAASYAEISINGIQSRPLPAPPRPPRKSKESLLFMDDETVLNRNESPCISLVNQPDDASGITSNFSLSNEISKSMNIHSYNNNNNNNNKSLMEHKQENESVPTTPRVPLAIEKLHVRNLEVDCLNLREIRAETLAINGTTSTHDLQTMHLESQTGQLQLSQLEFSQEVIKEIVRLLTFTINQAQNSFSDSNASIHLNGLNNHMSSGNVTLGDSSQTVSPNRSEPRLSNAHSPRFLKNETKSNNNDPLNNIAHLSTELIREILVIIFTLIYHSYQYLRTTLSNPNIYQQERNYPLMLILIIVGVLTILFSGIRNSDDNQIIHQWQYYSAPGGI